MLVMSTTETVVNSKSNPDPNGCNFYVIRKKRFCRLSTNDGEKYCAEHTLPIIHCESGKDGGGSIKRVVCPLDNKQ